jgi:hypothetical protein
MSNALKRPQTPTIIYVYVDIPQPQRRRTSPLKEARPGSKY